MTIAASEFIVGLVKQVKWGILLRWRNTFILIAYYIVAQLYLFHTNDLYRETSQQTGLSLPQLKWNYCGRFLISKKKKRHEKNNSKKILEKVSLQVL